jgi:hypothetical protein
VPEGTALPIRGHRSRLRPASVLRPGDSVSTSKTRAVRSIQVTRYTVPGLGGASVAVRTPGLPTEVPRTPSSDGLLPESPARPVSCAGSYSVGRLSGCQVPRLSLALYPKGGNRKRSSTEGLRTSHDHDPDAVQLSPDDRLPVQNRDSRSSVVAKSAFRYAVFLRPFLCVATYRNVPMSGTFW